MSASTTNHKQQTGHKSMVVNLSQQHSLISNWVSELRDITIQGDRMRFRRNLERIGEAAAYKISKVLPFELKETQTPLGIAEHKVLSEQPVLATILRAMDLAFGGQGAPIVPIGTKVIG